MHKTYLLPLATCAQMKLCTNCKNIIIPNMALETGIIGAHV